MVSNVAKEVRDTPTAGSRGIYPNKRSGEDKCGNGVPSIEGRAGSTQPICHGCG